VRVSPNVIVVLTDQLRAFETGCYGHPVVRTPNINRLARDGMRFELGITNNPVCTPARSCLLSGQYSRSCTGEVGNVAADPPHPRRRRMVDPAFPEILRDAGYHTALIGKWHIDPSPMLLGFGEAVYPLTIHRYQGQRFLEGDRLGPVVDGFAPDYELDRVEQYLSERANKCDTPFFLFYNISLPHEPIGPQEMPARYVDLYDRDQVVIRPNAFEDGIMSYDEEWFKIYQIWDYFWRVNGPCWETDPSLGYPDPVGEVLSDRLPEDFDLRDLTALYDGAVTCVDDLVGELLDMLDGYDLAEETVLLFTSDHGDNLGSHGLFNKDCLYEESIRIPFIWRHPGTVVPGVNGEQIVTLIDVMPTLLELCGLEIPSSAHGQSVAPVLTGERSVLDRNAAYIETDPFFFGRPTVGVRTPTHLYGALLDEDRRNVAEPWGFYDLRTDPFQMSDLLSSGDQAALATDLHQELVAWNAATPWLQVNAR
jgi:choline-sulfatase